MNCGAVEFVNKLIKINERKIQKKIKEVWGDIF